MSLIPCQAYPEKYEGLLNDKVIAYEKLMNAFDTPDVEVFESPREHYRMRAEFKVWRDGDDIHYAMWGEDKTVPVLLDTCQIADKAIADLMPKLMAEIREREALKRRLFQVDFLATQSGGMLVTLIYHRPLGDEWEKEARELQGELGVYIIGRSRKQKLVLTQDWVQETLNVNGQMFHYQQVENSFTQPNAAVNEKMLGWALVHTPQSESDLLELYCGNGNFTCVLSQRFRKVLATEIAKSSVKSAHLNFEHNGIENVSIARMSSEEFTDAMNGVREFRRLKQAGIELSEFDCKTIFVDPPRAGLDDETLKLVAEFDRVIYISCNPETLADNLKTLTQTHRIQAMAVFDQFPYTHHLESGVVLTKLSNW